jgi:hypothetical protein
MFAQIASDAFQQSRSSIPRFDISRIVRPIDRQEFQ